MKGISILAVAAFGLLSCDEGPVRPSSRDSALRPTFAPSSRGVTIRDLGTLGGRNSEAWDVSIDGRVVGWSEIASGAHHAFLWTAAGGMQDLGTLGGTTSEARGINGAGEIVGFSATASGGQHAFFRTAAGQMS